MSDSTPHLDAQVTQASFPRLRAFYDYATVLILAERLGDQSLRNVNTTIIYGTSATSVRLASTLTRERGTLRFEAFRSVISATDADVFVDEAQSGKAHLPGQNIEVSYTVDFSYDGLIPRGDFSHGADEQFPGSRALWRRRFAAENRTVGGLTLSERELADIAGCLPLFDEIDYELLNLESALDRLGALDIVYPSQVSLATRAHPEGFEYTVEDPLGWLPMLGSPRMSVECYRLGMLVGTHSIESATSGVVQCDPPHAVRHCLSVDGLVLDASGGTFIRRVGLQVSIAEPKLPLRVGAKDVSVSVAPQHTQSVLSGRTDSLPNVFGPRHLAALWREQSAKGARNDEIVFDGLDSPNCRVRGIEALSNIVLREGASTEGRLVVRVVDPYAIDAEALMALAPVVAGTPNRELWLLSNGSEPRAGNLRQFIHQEARKFIARFRKIAPKAMAEERFARGVSNLAQRLRVTVRWYKPSIALHDRFLEIGDRIWHVGHSYNRFGCDLSAIVEFRNIEQREKLRRTLDEQFSVENLERTFP